MNDEIKEIEQRLKLLHAECNPKAREEDINYTIDYITNLQQELEIMVKDDERSQETIIRLTKENERLKKDVELFKSDLISSTNTGLSLITKIDKAIEYFKYQLENLDFYEDTKARMLCAMGITLLQNGSDSQ